jgi:hypothetical protein
MSAGVGGAHRGERNRSRRRATRFHGQPKGMGTRNEDAIRCCGYGACRSVGDGVRDASAVARQRPVSQVPLGDLFQGISGKATTFASMATAPAGRRRLGLCRPVDVLSSSHSSRRANRTHHDHPLGGRDECPPSSWKHSCCSTAVRRLADAIGDYSCGLEDDHSTLRLKRNRHSNTHQPTVGDRP